MRDIRFKILFVAFLILVACVPILAQTSSPSVQPIQFQKAMVFIDGTNLIYRLQGAKLTLLNLTNLIRPFLGRRDIVRVYFYTIKEHFDKAIKIHGEKAFDKVRFVYGQGVPTKDGNVKEKGVDALLVADLIYHAANKNCDYALLVSVDADFVQALRRVEDFGCRTGVLAIGSEAPDSLRSVCDDYHFLDRDRILQSGQAVPYQT